MSIYSNPMSVCGKNPTAFEGTGKRKNRVGKRIKQFYLLFDLSQSIRTAILNLILGYSIIE